MQQHALLQHVRLQCYILGPGLLLMLVLKKCNIEFEDLSFHVYTNTSSR